MQHILRFLRWYIILFLIVIVVIISGCPPQNLLTRDETEEIVQDAEMNYNDVIKALDKAKTKYQNDLEQAYNWLIKAKNFLDLDKRGDASDYAIKSLSITRKIAETFYRGPFREVVETVKESLQQIIDEDPDNPLEDFVPVLDDILEDIQKAESGQQVATLKKIQADFREIGQIIGFIKGENIAQQTLTSDVSFDMGQYDLSEEGQQILRNFFKEIITNKEQCIDQFPGKAIVIKFKAIGYTDEVGFKKGTRLVKELLNGVPEDGIPKDQPARRKFLNKRLSFFRARTMSDYINQLFSQLRQDGSWVQINHEKIGRGEEIPPGVSRPYPKSDPRRRICKISSYVIAR